jgi:hypothetical protein
MAGPAVPIRAAAMVIARASANLVALPQAHAPIPAAATRRAQAMAREHPMQREGTSCHGKARCHMVSLPGGTVRRAAKREIWNRRCTPLGQSPTGSFTAVPHHGSQPTPGDGETHTTLRDVREIPPVVNRTAAGSWWIQSRSSHSTPEATRPSPTRATQAPPLWAIAAWLRSSQRHRNPLEPAAAIAQDRPPASDASP